MEWSIKYNPVLEDWLNSLDKPRIKSLAKEIRLLELCGNALRLPHSRALGDGLFELRERRFGIRVYYIFGKNKKIILLQGGDKTSQKRDINIAREQADFLTNTMGAIHED